MIRRGSERRIPPEMFHNNRGKKGWTEQEDSLLKQLVEVHGTGNWTLIAQSLPERSGKQCRERFHNHLDNGIKKGDWTEEEDRIIITLQKVIGNQWAKITKLLPGRTDNAVKNRFHATERAKLRGKLDESLLNDREFTEYIVKEAMRLNNEVYDINSLKSDEMDATSVESSLQSSLQRYPTATATTTRQAPATVPVVAMSALDAARNGHQWIQAVPVSSQAEDLDMDEEDDEEEEQEGGDLMELDIISFDEDDVYYQLSEGEGDQPQNDSGCFGRKWEVDPRCFTFDWGSRNNSNNNNYVQSSPQPPQAPRYNFCGLETLGFQRGQPAPVNAVPMNMNYPVENNNNHYAPQGYAQAYPSYQQQQSQGFQQQGGNPFYGNAQRNLR